MTYDLPIQQTLRRVDTRFQLGFATEAKERIPEGDGFVLSPSRQGLHVLARNEDRLSVPVETLRLVYGPASQFRRNTSDPGFGATPVAERCRSQPTTHGVTCLTTRIRHTDGSSCTHCGEHY